jgi:hypothetical protein
MRRQSIKVLLLFILLGTTISLAGQCDLREMKEKVLNKIKADMVLQDTSIFLDGLTAGIEIIKYKGDRYCDTIQFMFQNDCYLRFYLTTSNVPAGKAGLKLMKHIGMTYRPPLTLIKEIKSDGNSDQILTFDYYTKEVESFSIILSLEKIGKGCAYAAYAQYIPKEN